MQHFIRYDPRTGEITGHLRVSRGEITPQPRSNAEQLVEVTSEEDKKQLDAFDPLASRLKGRVQGGVLHRLEPEPRYKGRISLALDHPDRDGDGVSEVPADGSSTARVTATLLGSSGKPVGERGRISFSVTRGVLSARASDVKEGIAEVEWKAPAETVQARITARAEGFQEASLSVEFIPPDEHRELSRTTTQE